MLEDCPNCGSCWGIGSEEYDFQECDCCGYPDNMDDDCDDQYDDDYELDEPFS